MKKFKRILSIVLAMTMVLAMGMTAFASSGGTTDPVKGSMTFTGGKAGHTYTAYQILVGDATAATATSNGSLENIQWGADAPEALKAQYDTAAAAAKAIADQNDARAFAQSLNLSGDGTKKVSLTADGTVEFKDLTPGYYVVIDTHGNTGAVEGD